MRDRTLGAFGLVVARRRRRGTYSEPSFGRQPIDGATIPDMDPAIAGTLIGGGFALIEGLVGVAGSTWGTSRTLRANREIANDERLWEKRSALYEDLLRPLFVDSKFNKLHYVAVDRHDLQEAYDSLDAFRSAVYTYASVAVLHQYNATVGALIWATSPRRNTPAAVRAMEEDRFRPP